MALKKYYKIADTDNYSDTLLAGAVGVVTTVVFVNPTDNSSTMEVKNDNDNSLIYVHKTIPAHTTSITEINTSIEDENLIFDTQLQNTACYINIIKD